MSVIATAYFDYAGYEPAHPEGVVVVKCPAGFAALSLVWIPWVNGYRYAEPLIAKHQTEAAARAEANRMFAAMNVRLRADAARKNAETAAILAQLKESGLIAADALI